MMRVLHLVPALFDFHDGILGGGERYALELARHMADQVPTTLVSFGKRERHETQGRLKIHVLGNAHFIRGQRTNPVSLSLLSEIRKADIVHCHQQHILASSIAALLCRLTGKRVLVTDLGGGGWDISAYISTDRWYHAHLHISEYSRKIFRQEGKNWAHVVYGGVDTEKFSPDEAVPKNGTVLFVGRLFPHKGVDVLIDAMPPEIPLEIIGQAMDPRFLQDLKGLNRGKKVIFRHDCTDKDLIDAYRRALCVVLPSVYRDRYGDETEIPELLGQTLLEGMSCGIPALGTHIASLPEIVEDRITGFLVPPNDPASLGEKVRWFYVHPEQVKIMGLAARRRVLENFTWPKVVNRCLKIYGEGMKHEVSRSYA